jgi:lactoylglutathione lyase
MLELTHNHESVSIVRSYVNGNAEPGRGFDHIAITLDDVEKACGRLENRSIAFKKKPNDGRMSLSRIIMCGSSPALFQLFWH